MSASDLSALQERQQASLKLCDNQIKQWTAFCNEYNALKERLETLAHKTRHSVMVPVVQSSSNRPPVALVPGILQHTNEILVLLGDNWFVERSAKEAVEVVQRRLEKCESTLSRLEKERNQVISWINFTNNFMEEKNDFVEIVEQFDEEEEIKWREEHKRKVKQFKQQEALERMNERVDNDFSSQLKGTQSDLSELVDENLDVEEKILPLKSILKNRSIDENVKAEKCSDAAISDCEKGCDDVSTFSSANLAVSQSDRQSEQMLPKSVEKPFTGEIIERIVQQTAHKEQITSVTPRLVSKFKKERRK